MKNFKLLLATTAMLSISALGANADQFNNGNASIEGRVAIYNPLTIYNESSISFGRLQAADNTVVTISPSGVRTGTYNEMAGEDYMGRYFSDVKRGNIILTGALPNTTYVYNLPTTAVTLKAIDDEDFTCGTMRDFTQAVPSSFTSGEYEIKYGATFEMDEGMPDKLAARGGSVECQGSVTATIFMGTCNETNHCTTY